MVGELGQRECCTLQFVLITWPLWPLSFYISICLVHPTNPQPPLNYYRKRLLICTFQSVALPLNSSCAILHLQTVIHKCSQSCFSTFQKMSLKTTRLFAWKVFMHRRSGLQRSWQTLRHLLLLGWQYQCHGQVHMNSTHPPTCRSHLLFWP